MALRDDPDILECQKISGEESVIMKIVTPSLETLETVLTGIRD